jgi:hypothetical protein
LRDIIANNRLALIPANKYEFCMFKMFSGRKATFLY